MFGDFRMPGDPYLPPGCSQADIDHAFGEYEDDEDGEYDDADDDTDDEPCICGEPRPCPHVDPVWDDATDDGEPW